MTENFLLISDLDDTLLGDEVALQRFHEYHATFGSTLTVVYASGRFYESINGDIQTTPLPEPAAILGGVGSEIRSYPDGKLNHAWVEHHSRNWSAVAVRNALGRQSDLEIQPERFQSDFKVSYFLRDASADRLAELHKRLGEAGIDSNHVYSSNRDLDFLPRNVNKGTAAAFVAQELGFHKDHVIVAGNSGNDARLFEHGFYGVIVANAHDELKSYANNPRVFLSRQERADGVRDGLQHWITRIPKLDK